MALSKRKSKSKAYIRNLLPLYGPLNIVNLENFLADSKENFLEYFFMKNPVPVVSSKRFETICSIGKGNFGIIKLSRHKKNRKYYAMKTINKQRLISVNRVQHALTEKRILQSMDFPFCIRMEYFCKDSTYIYFVMPFVNGGDLHFHLHSKKKFHEKISCFYAAQVVLALEYLQYLHFVYRDLKPENILIDHWGYIKVADFGFTKFVEGRTYTLCGTPPYIAPEVLQGNGYGRSVDWWSLGILIYEMSIGHVPFKTSHTTNLYIQIMYDTVKFPDSMSNSLKAILRKLLQKDVTNRLGNMKDGADEVKREKWFKDIDWMSLLNRKLIPPFIPNCIHDGDTSNFVHVKDCSSFIVDNDDKLVEEFIDF